MSGEVAALLTAISWTLTGLFFQWVTNRIGSLSLNLIRLVMAFLMIGVYAYLTRGMWLPSDATTHAWLWLSISGLIGFVLGDYYLFKSYELVGARIGLLIFSSAPIFAGVAGFFLWGERLSWWSGLGIALVLSGIGLVILTRSPASADQTGVRFKFDPRGLLYAFVAAAGQAFGLIASKLGMGDYDPVAATQIRIIAAIIGFVIIYFVSSHWPTFFRALRDKKALAMSSLGALFGPFIGVTLSLYAVQRTNTAIASTIMSLMPVIIIPFSILIYKEKIQASEVLGAFVAIAGTAVLLLMN
ncbi:MAG TPA: DMT family transporter [Tissierellia bacterium]|nr:DMT family transporter [Tissierellia bacterium]